MAHKAIADLSEDFLQCSICMNRYNKPLMLPCVHSFCSRCLEECERNLQHQPFSCPTCRRIVELPITGVKDLPKNFFLTNLMERLEIVEKLPGQPQVSQCIFCKKGLDILFCLECKIYLCQDCRDTHSRLPGITDHTVIPTEKLSDANYLKKVTSVRAPQCNKHPNENMRFYCSTCNQLVCRDCTILSHREHECVEAESKVTTTKERLGILLEKCENYITDGLKFAKEIEKADKKLEENKLTVRNQIEECFKKLVVKLQADKIKLYQELEEFIGQKRKPLQQKNSENQKRMKAMENTQEITRHILEGDNSWEMLGMERDLENSFDILQTDPLPKNYDEIEKIMGDTLKFKPIECIIYGKDGNAIGSILRQTTVSSVEKSDDLVDSLAKRLTFKAPHLGQQPRMTLPSPMSPSLSKPNLPPAFQVPNKPRITPLSQQSPLQPYPIPRQPLSLPRSTPQNPRSPFNTLYQWQ